MRHPIILAPLALLAVASGGCLPAPVDDNDGLDDQLAFASRDGTLDELGPIAVGAVVPLEVAHSPKSVVVCAVSRSGGCSNPVVGSNELTPVSELVSASCDGDACRVDDATVGGDGWLHFDLTALTPGKTTLNVTVKLTDGSEYSDRTPLTFATPTSLAAEYFADGSESADDVTADFGSKYAVFPGASIELSVTVAGSDGAGVPLALFTNAASVTSSDESVVHVVAPPFAGGRTLGVSLQAVSAGTADITLAAAGLTRHITARVADPGAVASVELREIVYPARQGTCWAGGEPQLAQPGDCFDWDDDPFGAPLSTSLTRADFVKDAAVVLRMRDGSLAVGGAGFLTSSDGAVLRAETFVDDGQVTPTDAERLALPKITLEPVAVGSATVSGTIAGVTVSLPLGVE